MAKPKKLAARKKGKRLADIELAIGHFRRSKKAPWEPCLLVLVPGGGCVIDRKGEPVDASGTGGSWRTVVCTNQRGRPIAYKAQIGELFGGQDIRIDRVLEERS